jgi:nucleolar protein 14
MGGFTHKGRKLGEFEDDFNEKVELSSEDEEEGGRRDKGKLTDEMVRGMNFGGGDMDEYADEDGQKRKKTRKEVFDEIIEKSKAWNAAKQEMKEMNTGLKNELDGEFPDIVRLLDFDKKKPDPIKKTASDPLSYEEIAFGLRASARAAPVKQESKLTEHEQAVLRKQKLLEAEAQQKSEVESKAAFDANSDDEPATKKREQKAQDKREAAIERHIEATKSEGKNDRKADDAAKALTDKLKRAAQKSKGKTDDDEDEDDGFDSQLESDSEADESGSDEDESGNESQSDQDKDDSIRAEAVKKKGPKPSVLQSEDDDDKDGSGDF